jgi:hypothetical protein
MPRYEVATVLLVHVTVKVTIEAPDKESAIEAAAEVLPANYRPESAKAWKATVALTPPRGVECVAVKATHFEQASGREKARLAKEAH